MSDASAPSTLESDADLLYGLAVDRASALPLHAQVEALVRRLADRPELRDGRRRFPKELALAEALCVSRGTVRSAVAVLVREGRLERRAGVGTRVVRRRVETAASAWPSFAAEMRSRGLEVVELLRRWKRVPATREAAGALRVEPGAAVWRLSRVRGAAERDAPGDAEPVVWFRSWFAPQLGALDGMDLNRGLYAALAELPGSSGVVAERSDETVSATLATKAVARRLGVAKGSAVLTRRRVVYDAAGRPFEFAVNHYRADRFAYTLSLTRGPGKSGDEGGSR